jgi:putative transposase
MPRHARICLPDIPCHVVQRGHNRRPCFASDEDRLRYLRGLKEHADRYGVAVHAYALMTNHVHMLMTPRDEGGISRTMKALGEDYVRYFNRTYRRTGTLWEGRPYSCLVDSEGYFLVCHRYIECNPVRAGIVAAPEEFRWSSYRANALGEPSDLLAPHPIVLALGATDAERRLAYRELFRNELSAAVLEEIRDSTQGGFALGSKAFQESVSAAFGMPLVRRRRASRRAQAA